jgi:MFS superfamily sulfate permease-like transporter
MRLLLPHERWLVPWILRSQRTHRTAAVVAMEQRYGPDGMIWADASLANGPFVLVLGAAVFVIVFAHPTRTSRIAGYLLAAVFLFLVLSWVRLLQASRAGRKFRSDRK